MQCEQLGQLDAARDVHFAEHFGEDVKNRVNALLSIVFNFEKKVFDAFKGVIESP
jgi:hypothetical protein